MRYSRRTFIQASLGGIAASVLAAPAVQAQQVIRVGLIPSEDSRAMLASSKELLEMLEKNLGMKVQGFVASDYNGVIEAMRSGHIEVAYLGPFSYVLGTTIAPIEAFATAETAKSGPHLLSQPDHHARRQRHQDDGGPEGPHLRVRRSVLDLRPSVPEGRPDQDGHRPRHVFRPRAVHRLA